MAGSVTPALQSGEIDEATRLKIEQLASQKCDEENQRHPFVDPQPVLEQAVRQGVERLQQGQITVRSRWSLVGYIVTCYRNILRRLARGGPAVLEADRPYGSLNSDETTCLADGFAAGGPPPGETDPDPGENHDRGTALRAHRGEADRVCGRGGSRGHRNRGGRLRRGNVCAAVARRPRARVPDPLRSGCRSARCRTAQRLRHHRHLPRPGSDPVESPADARVLQGRGHPGVFPDGTGRVPLLRLSPLFRPADDTAPAHLLGQLACLRRVVEEELGTFREGLPADQQWKADAIDRWLGTQAAPPPSLRGLERLLGHPFGRIRTVVDRFRLKTPAVASLAEQIAAESNGRLEPLLTSTEHPDAVRVRQLFFPGEFAG